MSVVVAAFMGGLALGSRLFGAYAERVANVSASRVSRTGPGAIAFVVFYAIRHLSTLVYALPAGMNANSAAGVGVRLMLSFVILAVPTMIMGGTLPVLIRAVTAERKDIMRNTGLLYAFNTLGAMTGAFLVGSSSYVFRGHRINRSGGSGKFPSGRGRSSCEREVSVNSRHRSTRAEERAGNIP